MWKIRYFAGIIVSRLEWLIESILINLVNQKAVEHNKEIVLIKTDLLGDLIIWLGSAGQYRLVYPGYKITLICNQSFAGFVEAEGYFDEVIPVDMGQYDRNSNFRYRYLFRKKLKDIRAELVIQTMRSKRIHVDYLAASVCAKRKISIDGDRINESKLLCHLSERIYDEMIETGDGIIMEAIRNRIFLDKQADGAITHQQICAEDPRYAGAEKKDYFVLMPGASDRKKAWPIERFAVIAEYIGRKTGWACYVCGTAGEKDLWDRLRRIVPEDILMYDYMGRTTIEGLIKLIADARYLAGNDSAGMHMAVMTGTASTCICGEWEWGKFYPYPAQTYSETVIHNYAHAGMKCMNCNFGRRRAECKRLNTSVSTYECVGQVTAEQVKGLIDEGLRGTSL